MHYEGGGGDGSLFVGVGGSRFTGGGRINATSYFAHDDGGVRKVPSDPSSVTSGAVVVLPSLLAAADASHLSARGSSNFKCILGTL
jgi:hypothetical protein